MNEAARARRPVALGWIALAIAGVYGVEIAIASQLGRTADPDLLAAGIVLDLAALVPLAIWWFVGRSRGWSWIRAVPFAILGVVVASAILPEPHRGAVRIAHLAAVPIELGLLAWIGAVAWRTVSRARTRAAGGEDPVVAFQEAASRTLGGPRVGAAVGYEGAVLAYALGLPPSSVEDGGFTHHRTSAYPAVLVAVAIAGLVELVAVHLLIAHFHAGAAWVVTLLSAYAGVWLIADLRALARRPTRVTADRISVRLGLRWSIDLPFADIAAIERVIASDARPRALRVAVLGDTNRRVTLRRPLVARGPYGIRKTVDAVDLALDEPDRFDRTVRERNPADRGIWITEEP